jgi:hypothetical protein
LQNTEKKTILSSNPKFDKQKEELLMDISLFLEGPEFEAAQKIVNETSVTNDEEMGELKNKICGL